MRHFFNIEVRTIADTICNRKEFTIKVAGLSILVSWPWMSTKAFFKHAAKPRIIIYMLSKNDSNVGNAKILLSAGFNNEKLHAKMRVSAETSPDHGFKINHTLFSRIVARFDSKGILNQFVVNCNNTLARLKITLFGSGKAYQIIKPAHLAEARLGNFRKIRELDYVNFESDLTNPDNMIVLSQLDYDEKGAERLLEDIENR